MSRFIPLSEERFGPLSWNSWSLPLHADTMHVVPLAAPEASRAAAQLPLVFIKNELGAVVLCMLCGLEPNKSVCVNGLGQWEPAYMPAVVRTYPFRLMAPPAGQGTANQRVVCVDIDCSLVGKGLDMPFFVGQQPSAQVQRIIDFLGRMAKHYALTERAAGALERHGLLKPWLIKDEQGQATLGGLMQVDESKLAGLDAAALSELHRLGALALAYTQLISTQQLPKLWALYAKPAQQNKAIKGQAEQLLQFDLLGDEPSLGFEGI